MKKDHFEMNTSPLVFLARRVSTVLEPRFGLELAQDRAANLITGVACEMVEFDPAELESSVKSSLEFFRQPHCGGFDVSDEEIDELAKDTLTIILEELPLIKPV